MKATNDNLSYLCRTIGGLAGIPVRAYRSGRRIDYFSLASFPVDPIKPYEAKILSIEGPLGYFLTPQSQYYGLVKAKGVAIIIGPTSQSKLNQKALDELCIGCDVPKDETEDFAKAMDGLISFPLESLLQTLCSINFALSGEKKTLADITIYGKEQTRIENELAKEQAERRLSPSSTPNEIKEEHNTIFYEETLLSYVRHGDTYGLKELIASSPAISPGTLSPDAMRQTKNTFIVVATLSSRAAIRGGLDANEALSLSDSYIQKCESLSLFEPLTNLQVRMIVDFTERVERLKLGKTPTKLLKDVANYAQKHLSEPVSVSSLAKSLYLSRTYLEARFKKETGMTLTSFLQGEKIDEGKRLLRYSEKPISSIASCLGFSSPGHFAFAFKKATGLSPKEYRSKHAR